MIATTFASAAKISAQAKTAPAKTAAAKPHEEWAAGKIERFDASANTVVMKQGNHEMTFVLAPDAHVMLGKKAGQAADLASDSGKQARIRYTTQSDRKIADRVEIQETVKKK
ncbi:MAG TPA: hypothetical protein VMS54_14025 [Vicinamibacterales bacterium]|nr:hypothetical protein [Vicinamibacterales bacterium]